MKNIGKNRDYRLWRREFLASVTLGFLIVTLGRGLIKVHWTVVVVYAEAEREKASLNLSLKIRVVYTELCL